MEKKNTTKTHTDINNCCMCDDVWKKEKKTDFNWISYM